MKYYKISEKQLKDLLYAYYELNCLEANGVDNWLGYMGNKEEYIKYMLDSHDYKEDADFTDIAEQDLINFEEIPETLAGIVYKEIGSDNLDYIDNEIEKVKQEIKDKITSDGYFTYLSL